MSGAVRVCGEGRLETSDPSFLPAGDDGVAAADDFIPGAISECGVANIVWSTIFAYDTTKMANGPKTMADFFNPAAFPGKRGLRKGPKANLEMALAADGVAAADIYKVLGTPEGVDRAFAKLDEIKNDVIWWEAGAQPPQLLADGEVAMTTAYNGRIFNAVAAENKPFQIVWDAQIFDFDVWVIPKGAPNKDLAMDFLAFATDKKRLADQASWIYYGPARKSASEIVGSFHDKPELARGPQMPTAAANFKTAIQNSLTFWADHQDELNDRINAWLAGGGL